MGLSLRPYQLLCAVCALGAENPESIDADTRTLLDRVRSQPDMPVTLQCNAGDVFHYQNPGGSDDTPEGTAFNVRRDLEILQKLNLFPGCTLPARMFFHRLLAADDETEGICGYSDSNTGAWTGCPKAHSGQYQRGYAQGIDTIIPPRSAEEMTREKQDSLKAMNDAETIRVRPHILLCSVCQYGQGIRPPYAEDNLPELLALILRQPDRLIELASGADWMMCAPCPYRAGGLNACFIHLGGGGLANQLRDLRVLQRLELDFGAAMPARELFRLIFTRIEDTLEIDRFDHAGMSLWHDPCSSAENHDYESYAKGRELLIAALKLPL